MKPNIKEGVEKDFYVECNVCKQVLKNWSGSTPCCGSLSNLVEVKNKMTKAEILAKVTGHHADLLETIFLNNEAVTPKEAFDAMDLWLENKGEGVEKGEEESQ